MTEIRYHPKADDEVLDAARFYEKRNEGLGWRFLSAVRDAETRIARTPRTFRLLEGEFRRCIVRGFPHSLIFRPDDGGVLVVAVAHHSRRPGYWRRRVRRRA